MIRLITIEREYGSGAPDIARKLAQRLGWKLWDQLVTDEIARLMDSSSRMRIPAKPNADSEGKPNGIPG
jgi:hypothetical protein